MTVRYSCVTCGRTLEADTVVYRCPHCSREPDDPSGFPRGCLSVVFTPAGTGRTGMEADVQSFLPLPVTHGGSFPVGNTPMVAPLRLRLKTGLPELLLKNDTLNMSGSLKDRASLLVAEQALAQGERRVVLEST
jgi:threonine synthase